PDPEEIDRQYAERKGPTFRGQSPDGPADAVINLGLHGALRPDGQHVADNHSQPPGGAWFSPFTQLFAPRARQFEHAPVEPTTARHQSPDPGYTYGNNAYGNSVYGQQPAANAGYSNTAYPNTAYSNPPAYGQVPLGNTDPLNSAY